MFSVDGENWGHATPNVNYLNIKFDFNSKTVTDYKITGGGKTLTATIDKDDVKAIFGLDIDADSFVLEVKTNGKYLSNVKLTYTTAGGASAEIGTSYTYEPVAG